MVDQAAQQSKSEKLRQEAEKLKAKLLKDLGYTAGNEMEEDKVTLEKIVVNWSQVAEKGPMNADQEIQEKRNKQPVKIFKAVRTETTANEAQTVKESKEQCLIT